MLRKYLSISVDLPVTTKICINHIINTGNCTMSIDRDKEGHNYPQR